MEELLRRVELSATSDASVLILGESGTGKELLARALHNASRRERAPFVAINCAALPESLLESELFGHVKGAFTGAVAAHKGLFRSAEGGTLLLDEIGDMPLGLQVKLLRVLQERKIRPIGATADEAVDVRILSATHRNLEELVADGHFRQDLYYRLNVVSLTIPSLSERREDIPLLVAHFLPKLAERHQRPARVMAPEAMAALANAAWPGNVRQLINVIEQAVALSTASVVPITLIEQVLRVGDGGLVPLDEAKRGFERDYLVKLLKMTGGNVSQAARLAGRNRTELYKILQRHKLSPNQFKLTCEQ
jgi:two-component system response regulator GlrR